MCAIGRALSSAALAAALASSCARGPDAAAAPHVPPARSAPAPAAAATPRNRCTDPEIVKLRVELDFGHLEAARALRPALDRASAVLGVEEHLLRARLEALAGNNMEAIRRIETARRAAPSDPDVYATAAEIYAAAGKLDAGWDEEKAGERTCGEAPEFLRARGILWISRSGGARKGLDLLEQARRADPALPFTDRALSQAHLLVGKEDAAARKGPDALAHARLAASLDPEDVDARRFLAEALLLNDDFEGGVAEIQRLVDRGLPLQSELALLHKKAGIAALLLHDRPKAVVHFQTARKLGLTDDELSTGARVLSEEAGARVAKGIEAYQSGDLAAARDAFRAALDLDPDRIEAKNHLAVVLFKDADFAGAAALWREVLETAKKEQLSLPEPVHVNLAKALALAGDVEAARSVLEGYLRDEPSGVFVEATRKALDDLSAKKQGN